MSLQPTDPARHYDRVTEAWRLVLGEDLHYGVFERGDEPLAGATAALTDLMIEASALADGMSVLDVGCGTGAPACDLAERLGVSVTGITTSEVGLAAAEARARSRGLSGRVEVLLRDGTDNGLTDASFDRVWVLESSHLMRERERLLAECARVLRPGGRIALCDIVLQRPLAFDEVRRLREPLGLLRRAFGDARMEALSWYVEHATGLGVAVDVRRDLTAATRPTFDRWLDNLMEHRRAVEDLLGSSGCTELRDATRALASFWDDGTLGYGLVAGVRR
jgi:cyclopropane fatty-acyl-phospholipid synthase-like methyltransferase